MKVTALRRTYYIAIPILVLSLSAACSSGRGARGGEPEEIVIGIIDFEVENMNLTQARAVTDRFLYYLGRKEGLRVIDRRQMEAVLEEQGFRVTRPCSTDDCISQVGHILGAAMMVAGKVERAGDFYHLEARLVSVAGGRMVNHAYSDVRGIEDLMLSGIESVVDDLVADIIRN